MKAADIIKRYEKLKNGSRSNWENLWQEAADYCLPTKADVTTLNPVSGQAVSTQNYDATARNSLQILAAALHSYLTNPASKWFSIRTQDKALMQSTSAKTWLKQVEEIAYDTLNASNFGNQIHETYLDLGSMGTTVLYCEEDTKDTIRFYCRPLKECILSEGDDERVDTVFRYFKLTARQAHKRWGQDAGQVVTKAMEDMDFEKEVWFVHCVTPRGERDPNKADAKNKPFESKYVECSMKQEVWEGGYDEFPFFCPRFLKKSGDVYGYSPALVAMPDIKMLNAVAKTIIRGAQKVVDPPISIPNDGFLLPLNMNPAGVNYELITSQGEMMKPIGNYGNIPVGLEIMNRLEISIQKAFYVDVFLIMAQEKSTQTATEVNVREGEKMLILGPVLGRLMHELLNPLIQRTVGILSRAGKLPEMPEELKDKEFIVEYISPLAKAQKFAEVQSLQSLVNFVGQFTQEGMLEAADKLNIDKAIDTAGDVFGTNPEVINDEDTVAATREARAKQQQQAQLLAAAEQGGTAAKDLTQADKNMAEAKEPSGQA